MINIVAMATLPIVHRKKSIGRQISILIVDDNEYAARSLGNLLERNGHTIALAYDGETALRMARETYPDAIILDIGLPGMSGYETARILKQTMNPPAFLIALTGYGQEEDKRLAQEAGFDHHLTKPVLSTEIERLIFTHKTEVEKGKKER